jgi:hypothetical protein
MFSSAEVRVDAEFGVVIVAKPEHVHWAKGTLASVRYFMEDTPLCLLLDGERVPRDLETVHNLRIIRRSDVDDPELRELSFGGFALKNAVHWIAPFETFLYLDADTVVWGDLRVHCDLERFDFILDAPIGDPVQVRGYVMDAEDVGRRFPRFDARRYVARYVNTGAYFARRGVLERDQYLELLRLSWKEPGLFRGGDQGIFNFMVFSGADAGALRVTHKELQIVTGTTSRETVVRRFAFAEGRPRLVGEPIALHWAGSAKPTVRAGRTDYFEPMTFFRRQFRVALHGHDEPTIWDELRLRSEDMLSSDFRGSNLRGRLNGMRRRWRHRYAQARVGIRAHTPDWMMRSVFRRSS